VHLVGFEQKYVAVAAKYRFKISWKGNGIALRKDMVLCTHNYVIPNTDLPSS